ncbi:MAG: hypothetical protein HQK50_16645 [Oligoflexia bacterium]|nr:hypothetical protein [Oligoflexia bacterium]MBF0367207.1 hypothetical protein [Oligoflexia bacterium]
MFLQAIKFTTSVAVALTLTLPLAAPAFESPKNKALLSMPMSHPQEASSLEQYTRYYGNNKNFANSNMNSNKGNNSKDNFPEVNDSTLIDLGNDPLPSAYKALFDYILPSPDQHQGTLGTSSYINAGSCHFMATTGAMEILMNMDLPKEERLPGGNSDLSERWLMNMGDDLYPTSWLANNILMFNDYGGGMLNQNYRYTKGSYFFRYSVKYNWRNHLPSNWSNLLVKTPKVERQVLFGKRNLSSRYDVAVMSDKTVERIKRALVVKQGPVLVVYNDSEVWHAILVVGYDDHDSEEAVNNSNNSSDTRCPFVKSMLTNLNSSHRKKIENAMAKDGGCAEKGVFYVRESEYFPEPFYSKHDSNYDYDLKRKGEEQVYVGTTTKRSYEWAKYLASYAISIYRPDASEAPFPPHPYEE